MAARNRAKGLLVIGRGARGLNDDVEVKLRAEFARYEVVDFDSRRELSKVLEPKGPVVIAGGDGTVEHVVRSLADTDHPVGIIPLGTFNNFARALGLPSDVDGAVAVITAGRSRRITLGRVNGRVFLEAGAVGLFGEAILLGDKAKDLQFGDAARRMREVVAARPFKFEISGDLESKGEAMSLVFSNTSSIGLQLPVSDATPTDSYLEFAADAGQSVADIVGRALASTLLDVHEDRSSERLYRFRRLRVRTSPRVHVYADNQLAGRTPCVVTAEVSAVRVFLADGGNHK